jgi:hypothetical protein
MTKERIMAEVQLSSVCQAFEKVQHEMEGRYYGQGKTLASVCRQIVAEADGHPVQIAQSLQTGNWFLQYPQRVGNATLFRTVTIDNIGRISGGEDGRKELGTVFAEWASIFTAGLAARVPGTMPMMSRVDEAHRSIVEGAQWYLRCLVTEPECGAARQLFAQRLIDHDLQAARDIWQQIDTFMVAGKQRDSSDSDWDTLAAFLSGVNSLRPRRVPTTGQEASQVLVQAQDVLQRFRTSKAFASFITDEGDCQTNVHGGGPCGSDEVGSNVSFRTTCHLASFTYEESQDRSDCKSRYLIQMDEDMRARQRDMVEMGRQMSGRR